MSSFLEAAYQILRDAGEPMSAREIAELARTRDLIPRQGRTPHQTMKSKLSTDILRRKQQSLFMRTAQGRFALREWKDSGQAEFVANRHVKALLNEDAMVFPATRLSAYVPGPGLHVITPDAGRELIGEARPMHRIAAEEDSTVIQLVSGFVVQHEDRVLTYKRTKRLPEKRLHGEYSAMFGGHLNPDDFPPLFSLFEPTNASLMEREFNEELRVRSPHKMSLSGVLYDDAREVSRQHLAIVFDVFLEGPDYEVGERGFLQQDRFETWNDVGARLNEFENWSQLLYRVYSEKNDRRSVG